MPRSFTMLALVAVFTASESSASPEPAKPDDKAALLARETEAWQAAQPAFAKHCAACHSKDGKKASKKKLDHFDLGTYPPGGHHAATIGFTTRDVLGRPGEPPQPAHVEERLVDREPLDERCRVLEQGEHGLARLRVRRHASRHDDRVRAETLRLALAHRGADAVRLRLVACGQHDAAADDDRAAAQPAVVALLDGGEEGVEVGVEDLDLVRYEHVFV